MQCMYHQGEVLGEVSILAIEAIFRGPCPFVPETIKWQN